MSWSCVLFGFDPLSAETETRSQRPWWPKSIMSIKSIIEESQCNFMSCHVMSQLNPPHIGNLSGWAGRALAFRREGPGSESLSCQCRKCDGARLTHQWLIRSLATAWVFCMWVIQYLHNNIMSWSCHIHVSYAAFFPFMQKRRLVHNDPSLLWKSHNSMSCHCHIMIICLMRLCFPSCRNGDSFTMIQVFYEKVTMLHHVMIMHVMIICPLRPCSLLCRNGDSFTTTQVYYERVNSHTKGTAFDFTEAGVKDISPKLVGNL